jgi:ABC-type transport system involved in multi-copper enzyme maturation permease subunit
VTGQGDIAPDIGEGTGTSMPILRTLDGLFAGLIAAIVVGVVFVTAEYRRGLIRTTLTASPGRGRVLAAKAIVLGAVMFIVAFAGCAISVPVGSHLLRAHGNVVDPVSTLTWLRVVIGTAALIAGAAVLGVALGAIFRRGAAAVTTAFVIVVVPWFLGVATPGLPVTVSDWLLRLSPSAALAIQQTVPKYPQVASDYLPHDGFYPLAPWAGFAVLCAWIAAALWLAAHLLRRRDV